MKWIDVSECVTRANQYFVFFRIYKILNFQTTMNIQVIHVFTDSISQNLAFLGPFCKLFSLQLHGQKAEKLTAIPYFRSSR